MMLGDEYMSFPLNRAMEMIRLRPMVPSQAISVKSVRIRNGGHDLMEVFIDIISSVARDENSMIIRRFRVCFWVIVIIEIPLIIMK